MTSALRSKTSCKIMPMIAKTKQNVTLETVSLYLQTCLSREAILKMDKTTFLILLTGLKKERDLLS